MSRSAWRFSFAFTVLLVAWALHSIYPPKGRDLIRVFQEQSEVADTNLLAIVARAQELQKSNSNQVFANLLEAVGTNDLSRLFPSLVDPEATDQNRQILNQIQHRAAGRIKLGLDLQGGTSFLVEMDTNRLSEVVDKRHALEQAVEVLRKRVDRFGVAEPLLQPQGENRILIQLPGLSEAAKDSAKNTLQKAAFLEFRIVHPDSDELLRQEIIEPGYEVKVQRPRRNRAEAGPVSYLVRKVPEQGLTGKYVQRSGVYPDPVTGSLKITLNFNSEGASKFADITREHVGHQLAIVLDGELYSAPNINEPILGGSCEITGDFDQAEAFELANVLQNPLEAPVKIIEERGVDPSLGRDSINSGIKAALVGTIAVVLFMFVYYLKAGVVANLALSLNIVILMGVMCAVGTTLTLPGIAGIVLTIGMAVDANVLIFERIREESAAGKSIRGALAAGYDKAFGTILDSNLTTLISSVILIYMGTGPVKGFGVTLTIGITVSMFTALVVTRLIFEWLLNRGWLSSLPMLHLVRNTKLNFLRFAVPAFIASWSLILIGLGYGIHRGKDALGVDFRGGDRLGLEFVQEVEVEKIRSALGRAQVTEALIQYQKDMSTGRKTLQITTESGTGARVQQALESNFPESQFRRLSLEQVGATVGSEIKKSAIIALLLSMFGILVYVAFRYEFSFAVGAVFALVHDMLMTTGMYFLFDYQLSGPFVAAILTIVGFSINDTIVIFDRIREYLKLGMRGTFREIMNKALNQTLSRTIITSGTVFLATLSLYMFGGGAINDFSFAFLVGILTGTYSSIYMACAVVLWWHKGERPRIGAEVVSTGTDIEAVGARTKPA
ncbi:MAG TPA: protein translocase subunit SecD [Verrucomicrobiota bacterium]|nr:protein translocase subunit SecD [Verrucomicrobiota bacterium]HNU51206.1 protein translocase subunit SecD [Verrucomicrobiota bacterium]